MNVKRTAPLLLAAALLALQQGCGGTRTGEESAAYRRLAGEAVRLYTALHPLGASRLGLPGADSLLFTFGPEEIRAAVERLERLDDRLSALSAAGLSPREIDWARVMINWTRGERFALEILAIQRTNPLLFVWAAEEAFEEMPSRLEPVRPGEAAAYRKRVLATADLFSNAALALRNPAEAHARFAAERLDGLDARLDRVARLAESRYGASFGGEFATARGAVLDFRGFAAQSLLAGARGRLILGSENLSRIFLFDELLDVDPNVLLAETERKITRLAADRVATTRRMEFEKGGRRLDGGTISEARTSAAGAAPRAGLFDFASADAAETPGALAARVIDSLWTPSRRASAFGAPLGPKPLLRFPAETRFAAPPPKNPHLSLPLLPVPPVVAGAIRIDPSACRASILVSGGASRVGPEALRYALLAAAPRLLDADRLLCEAEDTVAAVFASETWREGMRHLALIDIADALRKEDPELYLRLIDDWTLRLARAIVVLRIHAGTLTTENAAGYFAETALIERHEAEREALVASISPSVAWSGISLILVERMLDRMAEPGGAGNPRREVRALLAQSPGLPLPVIERKIGRNKP
jgi:hypothetical protein